jgi:hypothetical protein
LWAHQSGGFLVDDACDEAIDAPPAEVAEALPALAQRTSHYSERPL